LGVAFEGNAKRAVRERFLFKSAKYFHQLLWFHVSIILTSFDCCFVSRLVFLLNIVELVSELEDSLRRVEVILIQQPGLTANLKDIQHQIKVLQVALSYRILIM